MNLQARCLWLVLSFSFYSVFAGQLTSITATQVKNKTILFFTINGPFTHRIVTLTNPNRIIVDLKGMQLNKTIKQSQISNGIIKSSRSEVLDGTTVRVVFEVRQRVDAASSAWSQNGLLRGVKVDLVSSGPILPKTASTSTKMRTSIQKVKARVVSKQYNSTNSRTSVSTVATATLKHNNPISIAHKPKTRLRDIVIVLDAGHGGKDPGAKGPKHSREKDVVLAITLKLKQLIDRQPGMRAVLTRSGDYYVGLRQRLDIARKYNGDIFVAIHADAFNNPHSSGASVFALSQSGATSEAARWIAEKENYSELGGVNLGELDDTNGVVRSVLIDLSQTATINASLEMGAKVLGQLHQFTRLHNQHVEQARFMVLKSPDIPSILVETGFISNPIEEKNLTSNAYQLRLSQAIFAGIKGYFGSNPPSGSRSEALVTNKLHIVQRGESLSAIAARYHTSVKRLQELNHLSKKPTVKIGQRLVISA